MQYHQVPPDTRDKEKIFGGIFTMSQFIFLVAGVLIGAVLGLSLYGITQNLIVMAVAFVFGVLTCVPFAFVKVRRMGDMELFKYVILRFKFSKRIQDMPHINTNYGGQ